jgi:hypothetical protein
MGLSACSSQPEILPSYGPRTPTSPDQVKLYQDAPKQYEELGTVTILAGEEGATWDERGDATLAFDLLKRKAAALGANGVLLAHENVGGDASEAPAPATTAGRRLVLAGYNGIYYQVPVFDSPRRALGQAIYVHKEK